MEYSLLFRTILDMQIRITPCKYMNFLNMFQIKLQYVYLDNVFIIIAFGALEGTS
ncbi:hypothetical protein HMPREF6745_1934 [Prevotella sp. oral taxon 472 str. F0295]|nr:hypothetical protein HMPREF6745_1934 [Prevotella sp. oral taxon 472 str. F0295]